MLSSVRTEDKAIAAMLERVAGESAWQVAEQREVVDPPAQIDKAAELQAKWGTATGQAWQIGPHRLVCGDCRDEGTVGRLWPDGKPKLRMVWTDPPYGVDYAAKNAYLNRSDRGNRIQVPDRERQVNRWRDRHHVQSGAEIGKNSQAGASLYATVPSGPFSFTSFRRSPQPGSPSELN